MAHKIDQGKNSRNMDKDEDELCVSVAHMNLKNGTEDPSRPSDKPDVNDMSGNKGRMNCYLTALVGNSRNYNKKGVKQFALDFNISVTNAKSLGEIEDLYTGLGQEEGYREMRAFGDIKSFQEFINNECEKGFAKKYIFIHYLSADESRRLHQEFDVFVSGHILSLKTRETANGQMMYLFIDYQKKKEHRIRTRNELPKNAFPPFYLFEKIKY